MSDRKKIIERVKKLMSMASDASSPNEAAIAAQRARKYMDKYELGLSDLTEDNEFTKKSISKSRKFTPRWESILAISLAKFNDCQSTLEYKDGGYSISFRGFDSDVKICEFMFIYLVRNGKFCCSKYAKEAGYTRYNSNVGSAFKFNYASALSHRLNEMQLERMKEQASSGSDLMVIKSNLVEAEFGEPKYKNVSFRASVKNIDAAAAGRKEGNKVSIVDGIEKDFRTAVS